jgi:hypothetical protein
MNINNKLKLDSRRRKRVSNCPCGKSNKDGKFVPYVGYDDLGFCHSCGETFLPKLKVNNQLNYKPKPLNTAYKPIDFIPFELFNKYRGLNFSNDSDSVDLYWKGDFANCDFLLGLHDIIVRKGHFLPQHFKRLLIRYQITPSGNNNGVVFWQIDHLFRIRNGKEMWYNPENCKRKNGALSISYKEKEQLQAAFNASSCFFGEHLLSLYPDAKVGLVESEKTALYMSSIYPNMVWLATGGKHGTKWTERSVFFPLIGRTVTVFPDLDAHDEWTTKANILKSGNVNVDVSNCLKNSPLLFQEQNPKADIMDFGVIENWQSKQGNERAAIIEKHWRIKPPLNAVKFIYF